MGFQKDYPNDVNITGEEKLLGIDGNESTKNFPLVDLTDYFEKNLPRNYVLRDLGESSDPVSTLVNSLDSFTITNSDTVYFRVKNLFDSDNLYLLKKNEGTYGQGGEPLTEDDFILISSKWVLDLLPSVTSRRPVENRAISNALNFYIGTSEKGSPGGVAELNELGVVPTIQLPSFIDDIRVFPNRAAFPATGEQGIIYFAQDTLTQYRWVPDLNDYAQIFLSEVQSVFGRDGNVTAQSGDYTADQITETDRKFISETEKNKLAGIASGAEVNVNADWNAVSGDAQILNKPVDVTDLSTHSVTELNDVSDAGSGEIITIDERTKLTGIETGAEVNNISDTNATDLTDGGESALHYHDSDRNRTNHTGTQTASTISDFDTEVSGNTDVAANTAYRGVGHIPLSQKGANNGVCPLDGAGLVPTDRLPGGIDDILVFANRAAFPAMGMVGIIYFAEDTRTQYRWVPDLSDYEQIVPGEVQSVFGRKGNVLAQTGDYNTLQITENSAKTFVTPTNRSQWDEAYEYIPQIGSNPVQINVSDGETLNISGRYIGYIPSSGEFFGLRSVFANNAALLNNQPASFYENVPTNLGNGRTATYVVVTSSTGSSTTLGSASLAQAGVMSAADKVKLTGIEDGAEVNKVNSVFGRQGNIVAQSGDYSAFYAPKTGSSAQDFEADSFIESGQPLANKYAAKGGSRTQEFEAANGKFYGGSTSGRHITVSNNKIDCQDALGNETDIFLTSGQNVKVSKNGDIDTQGQFKVNGTPIGGSPIQLEKVDIGPWNMRTTTQLFVDYAPAVGRTIIGFEVMIIADNADYYPYSMTDPVAPANPSNVAYINNRFIFELRANNYFDNPNFDSTSINRGYIIVKTIAT